MVKQTLRTRPCPERLAELMGVANLVPPEWELPGSSAMFDEGTALKLDSAERGDQINEVLFEAMRKFFEQHFPPEKRRQLYECLGPICLDRREEIVNLYDLLSSVRALLIAIADSRGGRIEVPYQAAEGLTVLVVDANGKIQVQPGPLIEVVKDVEVERIRRCSECNRLFWAGRMDKAACTKKCGQRRRVRLWRERYAERDREQYKLRRVKKANAAKSTGINSHNNPRRKSK